MNDRIKLLIEQAGYITDPVPNLNPGADPRLEKFAELIVRECTSIADDLVNRNADGTWTSNELYTDYNGALFEVKRRIEEHFGVAE